MADGKGVGVTAAGAGGRPFGSGQGVLVKSLMESVLPVMSSMGIAIGSVVAWISRSGSAGESGILKK